MTSKSPGANASPPPGAPVPVPFTFRLLIGFVGIVISAMMAGLADRVGGLALTDIRGVLGLGHDEGSWLNTVYVTGELIAMPFSIWLSTVLSLRRFHMLMTGLFILISLVIPWITNFPALLVLRSLQGVSGGMLIPILMLSALRYFPLPIRLYGMSLYALTATFSPNLGFWMAGKWLDIICDWRLVYWQNLPMGLLSMALVFWGIPKTQPQPGRLRQTDWAGMVFGAIGLAMIAVGLEQGERLDWWHSDLICWLMGGGISMTLAFLICQWYHPLPFIRPQLLLEKRNLGVGFSVFVFLLMVMSSGSMLPAMHLTGIWGFRSLQNAPIGLLVGLPQPVLSLAVALLLYQKWADARIVMAAGIGLIAVACLLCTRITFSWIVDQLMLPQLLQSVGQAMAVVSLLFLTTSVVKPLEGPFVSGTINTLRAFGVIFGSTVVERAFVLREHFHSEMLVDRVGQMAGSIPLPVDKLAALTASTRYQAFVLANADTYLMLAVLALLLIPFVLYLDYIPAPDRNLPAPINTSNKG
ncbi:MFS transporter [Desulfobacter sp.]|uniref:MFS transporter n=1 Tax=Desulfobacter sp. TaxID=2294 RepID=UPI003D147491